MSPHTPSPRYSPPQPHPALPSFARAHNARAHARGRAPQSCASFKLLIAVREREAGKKRGEGSPCQSPRLWPHQSTFLSGRFHCKQGGSVQPLSLHPGEAHLDRNLEQVVQTLCETLDRLRSAQSPCEQAQSIGEAQAHPPGTSPFPSRRPTSRSHAGARAQPAAGGVETVSRCTTHPRSSPHRKTGLTASGYFLIASAMLSLKSSSCGVFSIIGITNVSR